MATVSFFKMFSSALFLLVALLLLLASPHCTEAMRGYGRTIYKVANKAIPAMDGGGYHGNYGAGSFTGRRISPRVHYFVPVSVWNNE